MNDKFLEVELVKRYCMSNVYVYSQMYIDRYLYISQNYSYVYMSNIFNWIAFHGSSSIVLLSAYVWKCLPTKLIKVFFIFSNLLAGKWFLMKDLYKSVQSSGTYNRENTCTNKRWFLMKDLCMVASLIIINTLVSIKNGRESQAPSRGCLPQWLPQRGPWEQWTRSFSQRPQWGVTEASEPTGPFQEQKQGCMG